MSEQPGPHWVESVADDGSQYGTYIIDDEPVAGYARRVPDRVVTAHLYYLDEADQPRQLVELEGRGGPFTDIALAKLALMQVARPNPSGWRDK